MPATPRRLSPLDVIKVYQFFRHLKVHDVACIVAVYIEDSGTGINLTGHIGDLFCTRGLEDSSDGTSVDHAIADISQEQRKMSGSAAGHDAYLALGLLRGDIAAQVIIYIFHTVWMRGIYAFEHLIHIIFRFIQQSLHDHYLPFVCTL